MSALATATPWDDRTATCSALWVWADIRDTDADYSDNFMDLRRGRAGKIRITLEKPMLPYEFRRKLQVRSIYDIAPEMRA